MIRSVAILVMVGMATAATLTKKEGYGGSGYSPSAPSSYGAASGSSYDSGSSYGGGGGNDASYGGGSSATSYGGSSGGSYGQDGASGTSGGDSYGNLYYYYYPVQPNNHSSPPSSSYSGGGQNYGGGPNYGQQGGGYGHQGGGGGGGGGNYGGVSHYGGGGGNYYPPSNMGYNDPFGGLLSIISSVDINSLILPALLIGGVALLLPAILNCDLSLGTCVIPLPFAGDGGRNGRGMDDSSFQQMTIPQMVNHAYRIYDAVHESDICMQRVVCELGGMLRNVRGKDAFFSVLEQFASPSVKKQLLVLKQGAIPPMDAPPSCVKYICGKIDNKI